MIFHLRIVLGESEHMAFSLRSSGSGVDVAVAVGVAMSSARHSP